jgi:hypothetical protein
MTRTRISIRDTVRRCLQNVQKNGMHQWLLLTVVFSTLLLVTSCSTTVIRQQDSLFPSPVAFVTAGPLPVSSPTPTLAPVEQPTAIPPTASPKKLPIDSTAAIGIWSDIITSGNVFTGVVDIGTGSVIRQLQQSNLAFVSMARRQVNAGFGSIITDVLLNHADWLLYDKNAKPVFSSRDNNEPLLNIRQDEVKTQIADDLVKLLQAGPYDGILLDNVGFDLIRANNTPVFTGTKAFTTDQRKSAVEGLLRTIRARIPSQLMIIGGYAWEDGGAFNANISDAQELATLGDGVHIDKFLRAPISPTAEFKSESNWKKDIDFLAAISQDGKIVLVTSRLSSSEVPTDTARQWLNYSVASYLLGKNGPRTYFQFDVGGSLAFASDPILTLPIGSPQEAYTKLSSGIYRRVFSNGIALVNPTSEDKESEMDADYRLPGGVDIIKKITMPAHTGTILLKP